VKAPTSGPERRLTINERSNTPHLRTLQHETDRPPPYADRCSETCYSLGLSGLVEVALGARVELEGRRNVGPSRGEVPWPRGGLSFRIGLAVEEELRDPPPTVSSSIDSFTTSRFGTAMSGHLVETFVGAGRYRRLLVRLAVLYQKTSCTRPSGNSVRSEVARSVTGSSASHQRTRRASMVPSLIAATESSAFEG